MLLTQLINQQQSTYAQIQAQIEVLQEQQRQIQAYLQRLGSVESQMVSAAQVVQEAIASINEVCPDELASYKELITGLFNKPTAAIAPSFEPLSPTPPSDDEAIETASVVVDNDGDDEPDPTPPSVEPVPVEETTSEETLLSQVKEAIASNLNLAQLQNILSIHQLNTSGNQKTLKKRFTNYCETVSEVELERIWEYLNAPTSQAQAA